MHTAIQTCVFLAFCCASGAHAKRLSPTSQAGADRLGVEPQGLQQAWISAIAPEERRMPSGVHTRSQQVQKGKASHPITPARVQFGNAPQLNAYEEGGLGKEMEEYLSEWMPGQDQEYLPQNAYEDEDYLAHMHGEYEDYSEDMPSNSSGSDMESDHSEDSVNMNGVDVSGSSLRSTVLTDISGHRVPVSSLIGGEGKAVIVFLRHLGCPLCWDYALKWQKEQPRMAAAGIAGPMFISVGTPEQLQKFLHVNEELDGALALVDDSADFAAYAEAGFNYLPGNKVEMLDFKPPSFGPELWLKYLANAVSLSPNPKCGDDRMELSKVPDGVKVLGGTYAIDGDVVKFSHQDLIPGDTPDIEAVLESLGASSQSGHEAEVP